MWIPFALISAVLLAFYDLSKKKSVHDNAVMPVLYLGTIFGALGFSIYLLCMGQFGRAFIVDSHTFWLIFIKSSIIAVSWVFAYYAMRELPFSIAAPIRASVPFWTLLGAIFLYGEVPSWMQAVGICAVLVGYGLFSVAGKKEGIHFHRSWGIFFAFAGTLLGSCSALYDKFLLQSHQVDRLAVQLWFELDLVIIFTFFILAQRLFNMQRTPFQWRWSIPAVGLFLVAADWFYFAAVSEPGIPISIVSMLRRANVVVSFAMGAFIFHEQNIKHKAIALAVLILGIAILCCYH
ncbi:MAG: DMT family transporter [bacterium]